MRLHACRRAVLATCGLLLLSALPALAVPSALIVIGSTGGSSIASDLAADANEIHDALVARNFAPDAVEILKTSSTGDRVTADRVRTALKKRATLGADDEFWLILLGFSARSADGMPAFQVVGPRLRASDLKALLDAIPAKQYVFVGTSESGSFVPILLTKTRTVLAATREQGEIDLPRFPKAWADALKEKPTADWKAIAARAAEINDKDYADESLAIGEHARLGDPETGQILEAPFGVTSVAKPAPAPPSGGGMALLNASDIKVEIHKPNDEWEQQPATDETKKLIAEARAAANPDGFNALIIEQRLGYRVGDDRTAETFTMKRIYIEQEDGVVRWANFMLPQDPPAITTKLEAARIIQPDGSQTVFNPAKVPKGTDASNGMSGGMSMVFMPGAHAGCLVEIAYRSRELLDADIPEYSDEIVLQQPVPALKTELQLQIPDNSKLHFKLRNSAEKPVEAHADSMHTVTWTLSALPAFESLPNDPPPQDFVTMLDVSSLDSWDSFAAWYRRISRGADEQDAAVKAKAEELAAGATTRVEKIHKAYDFVSALRYVAIEFGIGGFRPRTPMVVLQNRYGDCKDKANLLVALLTDMGIDARFCLLNRGLSTDTSFPSWQFNHAIAFVPKSADQPTDLFLDTTDSTAPFPTLAPGDIGRNALVFDKTSAQFLKVTPATGEDVTSVSDNWNFKESVTGTDDRFDGTLQTSWTGLADYEVRAEARGLSPRQRDYALQTRLMNRLRNGDFSKIALTPTDDLSHPMSMTANVSVAGSAPLSPLPGLDVNAYFASPQRDRPLLINNGQRVHVLQKVQVSLANARPNSKMPAPFDQQVVGVHATISWQASDPLAWTRTAELTIDQPEISPTDYAAVRQMLRQWIGQLAP